jgi:hypothetical protein|tara:strand:+ start:582 stop:719 length:138 start_codon:yes stop_codon:yes gene_type:complete
MVTALKMEKDAVKDSALSGSAPESRNPALLGNEKGGAFVLSWKFV